MTGWIGISLGDITGIGPEVTLKALVADNPQDKTRYLLIGDTDHVRAQINLVESSFSTPWLSPYHPN